MKLFLIIILLLSSASVYSQSNKSPSNKIGFISVDLPAEESSSVNAFLDDQKDFSILKLEYETLIKGSPKDLGLNHIWIHKLSPIVNSKQAIEAGSAIKTFVKNGGNLILSMEAVGLLNDWGIEKNPFEVKTDSVKDNGFGRPLGFHSFKSHPIFDGLHGGAYCWKGKKDHIIRKLGFFNDNLPDTSIAKVIGIEWTYITFHEQNKLVLEYQLGKGKIIAVGAYSYFAAENFNTLQLHKFYRNLFDYCAGQIKGIEPNYWNYSLQKVLPLDDQFSKIDMLPATQWKLPKLPLEITKQEANNDFVSLAGRRMLVMGKQKGGIDEIWTHPFMSFRDVEAGVVLKSVDSTIWLNNQTPSVTVSPSMIIRKYRFNNTVIKEVITVSMDKPIAVVHYEWEGEDIKRILIKYTSNFRYMWPYSDKASASIRYRWAPELNAAVSSAQKGQLVNMIGFSAKPDDYMLGQFQGFEIENNKLKGNPTELIQTGGIFSFNVAGKKGTLNSYLVAGNEGVHNTIKVYHQEYKNFEKVFEKSSIYFAELLKNSMSVTTPDEQFNEGFKWAIARTDQFFQETPGLGTSLMAGFGTTSRGWGGGQKISGRPGYAWYFGRDAQWCGMAINAYGGHEMIKKTLDVFVKFQDLTGKIYHELTSSGAVHYDASDATPLFVVLAANYLKYSGDLEYISKIWKSIGKAMEFCYSTDTDQDGLIEITNVGHGWIEGGALYGAHTEIYLAGVWAAALDAASYMSLLLNHDSLATKYNHDADRVRKIIDEEFWINEEQYFSNGKMIDGSFMKEETILTAVPIYFNAVIDSVKALKTTNSFSGNGYSTDWGVRIIPEESKNFNPKAYHAGMVWPLFSGFASLAEYKTGAYVSGYSHIMDNLLLYKNFGLGSAEETLNGIVYNPAGVCSQQGWSETMILQPIFEGMIGYSPDAVSNQIKLSPRLPWNWDKVEVKQLRFGNHRINFTMNRTTASTTFQFVNVTKNTCSLLLFPSMPVGTTIQKVLVNKREIKFSVINKIESVELSIAEINLSDKCIIEIHHEGGIGALAITNEPKPGDINRGLKIVNQELNKNKFTVIVDGLSGEHYEMEIFSNFQIKSIKNGEMISKKENIYKIKTIIPSSTNKYLKQKVVLSW
ncbi:MAG: amylo-alpha-1,6-glucosidase [Chitinophagaceae bacterium]